MIDTPSNPAATGAENVLTVFVVDDLPSARAGLTAFLNSLPNIEVVGSAVDGVEAVEGISAKSPDVAIMDIEMPRMDGLEAIRQLRANGVSTPIIALSIGWEFREPALAAGANAFLYKGEPLTDLVALLEGFRPAPNTAEQAAVNPDNPPITIIELETAYGLMHLDSE